MSWHNDEKAFILARGRVAAARIPEADKQNIFDLVEKLLATRLKKRRAVKYYYSLAAMMERGYIETYQGVSEKALYRILAEIENSQSFGYMAKRDYKIALKRMLEHLNNPLASIIRTAAKPQYLPRFFLTVHDILKMVKSDWPHLRDKAIVACLYESNCRPHEFFMLKRSDIRFETVPAKIWNGNGGMVNANLELAFLSLPPDSKTGPRNPPLIFSVPWLKTWLSVLPGSAAELDIQDRNNERPLWIDAKGLRIQYSAARKAVKLLARHAGIEKWGKVTLYSFRHGRNTEVSQFMTHAQQCEHAGWQQGSDMPRVYNHLAGMNLVSPILAPYGIYVDKRSDERNAWLELMKEGRKTG